MDFKNVPKKYRPIPFWSWNEKLDTEETSNQIKMMDKAGIGGFFMHARGGLQTEYMSEEWFDNVSASIQTGKECGMRPWAYDENGWPSGFANGAVNGLGVEYQQKYLRYEKEPNHNETAICKCGDYYFYYDINPFYVDTLDKKVIAEFIKEAYLPYYEKYKNEIEGFFTDEPQISRNGIPWSFIFEDEYKKRYNENILEHLDELYFPIKNYKQTRVNFWKMVTELFSENFMKQIYDWCDERGLKLTGHLVLEENLIEQLITNGACMPHYEYFHIPGMDWLGRNIYDCLTPIQVSSVAEQFNKEAVLSETFALCGHNVSLAELKGIFEWQMVHGINLLCQHLEGYSIRGMRKRDYPPAMYYQQPWWCEYDRFNDAMSRTGMILANSHTSPDILVIHPQTTAWAMFDNEKSEGLSECNKNFIRLTKDLEAKHVIFHLGDEIIMERHAKVENGRIVIGNCSYDTVICDYCDVMLDSTKKLLDEFTACGGKIVTANDIPENPVTDNAEITYTKRMCKDYTVHYFVNTSADRKTAKINVTGKAVNIYTGELDAFEENYEFEPWGSLLVIEDDTPHAAPLKKTEAVLSEAFKLKGTNGNLITLDRCDYYFDDELQEKNGYVLNITERANALEKPVRLHMDYHVKVNKIPEFIYLVCESPEKFSIKVNGVGVCYENGGYFIDKSFRRIDISDKLTVGENTISFDCVFRQSDSVYENLKKAAIFESEKNKLVYDTEIEAVYLTGSFGVKTPGTWTELPNNAVRYSGAFEIDSLPESLVLTDIQKQGFPFFCGNIAVEGTVTVTGENPVLKLKPHGISIIKAEIDGKEFMTLTDNFLPLPGIEPGEHKITLTLINNLRNALGPHHLKIGESFSVTPASFFKEACVWSPNAEENWDDDYCFVKTQL